jgi:hypothetical protein
MTTIHLLRHGTGEVVGPSTGQQIKEKTEMKRSAFVDGTAMVELSTATVANYGGIVADGTGRTLSVDDLDSDSATDSISQSDRLRRGPTEEASGG